MAVYCAATRHAIATGLLLCAAPTRRSSQAQFIRAHQGALVQCSPRHRQRGAGAPVLPSSSLVRALRGFKQQWTPFWPPERSGRAAGQQATGFSAVLEACGLLFFSLRVVRLANLIGDTCPCGSQGRHWFRLRSAGGSFGLAPRRPD